MDRESETHHDGRAGSGVLGWVSCRRVVGYEQEPLLRQDLNDDEMECDTGLFFGIDDRFECVNNVSAP